MTLDHLLDVTRTTMQNAKYCILATQGDTRINARVLQPFDPQSDWTIFFGTRSDSRKVVDIQQNPNTTLLYYDHDDIGYVSLQGTAKIVDDPVMRQQYWNANWRIYFPKGPDEDYTLIQFVPDRLEVLSFGHGVTPEPYGLKPAVLIRNQGDWQIASPDSK